MKVRGLLLFSTILFLWSCNGEQQAAGKEEERLVADMTCGLDATAASGNTYGTDCKGLYDIHSNSEFFPEIPYVKYEGPASDNPLSYKWYNAEEVILGKKMKDWLRFSIAFWHTFRGDGGDPFGSPTKQWRWEDGTNSLAMASKRMQINFEFLKKLGVERWCFHDRDIAPEGSTIEESNANLDHIIALAKQLQEGTSIRPLWGTAQLFKHPRFMHGAATSPDIRVYAYAAAQVKKAMEVTHELGGENYVFWGGREGYQTLLNTDLKKELDHMATFLQSAASWKKKLGFKGNLLLEPKPQEPTKHQYVTLKLFCCKNIALEKLWMMMTSPFWSSFNRLLGISELELLFLFNRYDWDAATTMGFLQNYGLAGTNYCAQVNTIIFLSVEMICSSSLMKIPC
jgi:xylose isomerase